MTREKQLREYCAKTKKSMSSVIDEALGVFIEDIELQPKIRHIETFDKRIDPPDELRKEYPPVPKELFDTRGTEDEELIYEKYEAA